MVGVDNFQCVLLLSLLDLEIFLFGTAMILSLCNFLVFLRCF